MTHQTATASPEEATETGPYSRGYTNYAMWLLMGLLVVNFLDRQIVNILAEPIKTDLGLKDWQLGLMTGLAFALFYTFMGIPVARLAERHNRAKIIGTSVAIWSGFTALCGTAANFWQLVLFRIGVGIGEAGGTPPAHSLIVDYVPKARRASALAFYSMGNPIGGLVGLVLGGLVADAFGWRAAFLVAGAPGLIFALLVLTTLKEPRKRLAAHTAQVAQKMATFTETLAYLAGNKTFWLISGSAAIKAFIGYGHAPFTASFFLRYHTEEVAALAANFGVRLGFDLQSIGFLGLALGLASGVGGAIGSLVGGAIADKYAKHDIRAYMTTPALATLVGVPVYITALSVPSAPVALVLIGVNAFLTAFWYGPVFGTAQSIARPNMRATTAALLLFVVNLVGLGLGPLATGLLSDLLNYQFGLGSAEGLRWALIIATCFGLVPAAGFWLARRTIAKDAVN